MAKKKQGLTAGQRAAQKALNIAAQKVKGSVYGSTENALNYIARLNPNIRFTRPVSKAYDKINAKHFVR